MYQSINKISKAVANKDLSDLVNQKLIQKVVTTGKVTKYRLPSKSLNGLQTASEGLKQDLNN